MVVSASTADALQPLRPSVKLSEMGVKSSCGNAIDLQSHNKAHQYFCRSISRLTYL